MTKNLVFYRKNKHIDIKYHFIREIEANKEIELKHFKIEKQLADIFAKALPQAKFKVL